jgi:hypothetical protein
MTNQMKIVRRSANNDAPDPGHATSVEPLTAEAATVTNNRSQRVSKPDLIKSRLEATGGATIAELVAETGWQPHSIRAAMTGLRKQGLTITKTPIDGATRFSITCPKVVG